MSVEEFFALHAGLPRQSPGSDATTQALLGLVGSLPTNPRVIDIGCGPGRSTLVLARHTGGQVLAIDTHQPFLAELQAAAHAAGCSAQVTTSAVSMDSLGPADGPCDLVWSEGAAYLMGFDAALRSWALLLAPSAPMVVTECVWTTDRPSEAAREFWRQYPGMRDHAGNVAAIRRTGLRLEASLPVPDEDWWEYYTPLEANLDAWPDQESPVVRGIRAEIALRREHPGDYGYQAYVLRR